MTTQIVAPKGDSHGTLGETVQPRKLKPQKLRSLRERQLALLILCIGTLVIILDGSVVNVALPSIRTGLGFSQENLAWVVNAYLIPFGGLLLFAGRLGDLVGPKKLFVGGLALFTVASVACGTAQSQEMLIGARFVQGVGGALAAAVVLGMLVTMFPKPREQARALGFYGFIAASGAAFGLLAGAALTQAINWHWIFFVNVPIGALTILFALRLLDDGRSTSQQEGLDVLGAVLIVSSLMLWVYTIVQAVSHGWTSTRTLEVGGAALVLLIGFVIRQALARNPLVPLNVLGARNVAWSNVVQALMVAGPAGMFFLGALYLQQVLQFSVIKVGFAFLPVAVAIAFVSLRVTPRLMRRVDAKTVLVPGLVVMAVGLGLFTRIPVDGQYARDILPAMLLIGIGVGLGLPAVLTAALADSPQADTGIRSGLVNTTQQLGSALGLAVLATVSTSVTTRALGRGETVSAALTSGYHTGFLVGTGIVVAALLLAITMVKTAVPKTAPTNLDDAIYDDAKNNDLTGAVDADFLAVGMGATNMMAMLWSIAMGKRAVGVELRGDPFVSVMHWNIREDLYHHLYRIDEMMMERYGEDRIPRRGDGSLFLLHACLFGSNTGAGDARTDEVVSGWTPDSHIGGIVRKSQFVDDRWIDGEPQRSITTLGRAPAPEGFNPEKFGRPIATALQERTTFQAGAEELLILLRRYLEEMERMDLGSGVTPRCRLFTYHRVVPDRRSGKRRGKRGAGSEGFVKGPDGRTRIRVEAIRELDEKRSYRRVRKPGSEVIDLGTPELFMIAEGLEGVDAKRLGFEQELVRIDHHDGRGPVVAQADYLIGLMAIFFDSDCRERIASEFDKQGNEYWVRQIGIGHEDDSEIGWILAEVPEYKTFDPVLAGLVPAGTDPRSKEYYAGYQHVVRDYYLDQVSLITEVPKREIVRTSIASAPKLFSVIEKIGLDAMVAPNGVVAGDSFGNGHFLTSGGVNTGMVGHAYRVLGYWQARERGAAPDKAIRRLADAIKEDTRGWLKASEDYFRQPESAKYRAMSTEDKAKRDAVIEATRKHRRSIAPVEHRDEWSRLVLHVGRLYTYVLPPLEETHPEYRGHLLLVPDSPAGLAKAGPARTELAASTMDGAMVDNGMAMGGDAMSGHAMGGHAMGGNAMTDMAMSDTGMGDMAMGSMAKDSMAKDSMAMGDGAVGNGAVGNGAMGDMAMSSVGAAAMGHEMTGNGHGHGTAMSSAMSATAAMSDGHGGDPAMSGGPAMSMDNGPAETMSTGDSTTMS